MIGGIYLPLWQEAEQYARLRNLPFFKFLSLEVLQNEIRREKVRSMLSDDLRQY